MEYPEADMKTRVLTDGRGLIQPIGRSHRFQTFGDYAGVFMQTKTRHFCERTTRVDELFDRYIGEDSIKTVTQSE